MRPNPLRRWYGWWYLAIGAGFILLAIDRALRHADPWLVGVRVAIAVGFLLLAYYEFRLRQR